MRTRIIGFVALLVAVAAVTGLLSVPVAGQTPAPGQTATAAASAPARASGELTIAGQWDAGAGQANYTLEFGFPEEHAALMQVASTRRSVIVDPPDGRIPFQPWAMAIRNARDRIHTDVASMKSKDLDTQAKCYPTGVPRFANRGGPFFTIFPDYVLLQIEYGHEYRIIYTDGRPRLPRQIKLWNGDARGHWEGATFVVETTNLNGYAWLDVIGSFVSDQATVVERFTPLDANTLRWTGTVTDPTVFTRPWTMGWNYVRSKAQGAQSEIWENACAEGNNFKAWDDIYARELPPGASTRDVALTVALGAGRISPGRKGATRDGCPRNINEITRSAPIRRRIANSMMDHPTDDKSSFETCVAGVRSAEVWR